MDVENDQPPEELESREPSIDDLVDLCRELNRLGARYLVIGGFAMRGSGYLRNTMDIDLMIDVKPENEAKVYEALRSLPDQAVNELEPGDVAKYTVVRVADEIVIDLMQSAGDIDYAGAASEIMFKKVRDVEIPFASPRLLWRMKANTHREKDAADLLFLKNYFEARGEPLPS